ncbi:MAG TPA: DUF3047 domain-containing protein [Bryobacteraceae bacterium]|nr:DUF3047 domain-containing protein [Bryobacteraceae bacterium]
MFVFQARTSPLALIVLDTASWGAGRFNTDWKIEVNRGKPDVSVCQPVEGCCLHLKSVKSSFSLERSVDVDPNKLPVLTWRWKVAQIPPGGDFRRASTDDQAAQVLVAFADRKVVSYIWDSTAPKGAAQSTSFIPLVHVFAVVCESGSSLLNQWVSESQNVAADYQRAYGKPAPHVKGLRLQINSQHTGATAESYFGEVAFRSAAE